MALEKGQSVQVFQDPITQQKPEGLARLITCLDPQFGQVEQGTLQRWTVRFPGDQRAFERTILVVE